MKHAATRSIRIHTRYDQIHTLWAEALACQELTGGFTELTRISRLRSNAGMHAGGYLLTRWSTVHDFHGTLWNVLNAAGEGSSRPPGAEGHTGRHGASGVHETNKNGIRRIITEDCTTQRVGGEYRVSWRESVARDAELRGMQSPALSAFRASASSRPDSMGLQRA